MALGLSAGLAASPLALADTFSGTQKKELEQMVHEYLVNNPEVLIEASQALQQKQQKEMQSQAQGAITANAAQLFAGSVTTMGNPKGNVTVVEFFDYQCMHCKKMKPVLADLLKKDKSLRVIYMEFPIFGKSSEVASRAALAAAMQGKYQAMHNALFDNEKHLDEDSVMKAAKAAGLDVNKLKQDMQSEKVTKMLDTNRQLAEKLHLMGTPAFIVASTPNGQFKIGSQPAFVPGATTLPALEAMIKHAGM